MHEPSGTRIHRLDSYFPHAIPVCVESSREDTVESSVDPNECSLVVLQVDDRGVLAEQTGLDDHVELVVNQPRITLRHNLHAVLQQWIEQPVPTFAQESLELTVAEVQTDFVAANSDSLVHCLSSFIASALSFRVLVLCN